MEETTRIVIEMPFTTDFVLQMQLQKAMRKNWEQIHTLVKCPYYNAEIATFEELIDATADILLQIIKQIGYQ